MPLIPSDLASLILLFEPRLEGFEVIGHRPGRKVLAGSILQNCAPVLGLAFFHDLLEERTDFLVVSIVTSLRRLMQDLACNMVVKLEL